MNESFPANIEKLRAFLEQEEKKLAALIDSTCGFSKKEIKPGQFQCAMCQGVFNLNQDPEYVKQAEAEWQRDFAPAADEHRSVVCDDCYQKVRPDKHPKEYAEYKSELN